MTYSVTRETIAKIKICLFIQVVLLMGVQEKERKPCKSSNLQGFFVANRFDRATPLGSAVTAIERG